MMMERFRVLPESILKIAAVLSMAIDHIGASVLFPYVEYLFQTGAPEAQEVYQVYWVLRYIGRLAFPIYCYLMTEGFFHTRNKWKYARNLFLFALISEIPFDLALSWEAFCWEDQNVFWTLLFGLLGMMAMQKIWETEWQMTLKILLMGASGAAMIALAHFMHTDYEAWGVAAILVMYVLRNYRLIGFTAGLLILIWMNEVEVYALFALPLVFLYNGERGKQKKWFFYAFYPGHFLVLYFIYLFVKNRLMW